MRRLVKPFLAVFAIALMASATFAQDEDVKKLSDYKNELKTFSGAVKGLDSLDFFKKSFTFKNNKTGETKKFEEFGKFDQDMLRLTFMERIVRVLEVTENSLSGSVKTAEEGTAKDNEVPKKDDLQKMIKEVQELRKTAAVKWEAHAEKVFKDWVPKEIPEKDRDVYLKRMKDYNDKNKLIERK